jgi:hypothetical protein
MSQITDKVKQVLAPHWKQFSDEEQAAFVAVMDEVKAAQSELDRLQSLEIFDAPLPEAPVSVNVYMVEPNTKANIQFTFRGFDEVQVMNRLTLFLVSMTDVKVADHWLTQDAYRDANWGNRRKDELQQPAQPSRPATATAPSAPQPAAPTTVNEQAGSIFMCDAKELLALPKSDSDNTLMWKVMTSKSKYPVAMYDEVVKELTPALSAAGIDLTNFVLNGQPAKYNLAGWAAHYVLKDDGKYPKKIVNLTK